MPTFSLLDRSLFSDTNSTIKRPREIAFFSFDDRHACHPLSDRSIRYHYPPFFESPGGEHNKHADLSQGFESFRKFDLANDLHLDALLETLVEQERQQNVRLDADFITWRGMMTKIVTAAYDEYAEFEMNATCYQGTIFIEENHRPKQSSDTKRGGFSQAQMEFWGYKFETLSTLPRPWAACSRDMIENRAQEIVDNFAQYCSIVRTGIGGHTIILGGEVDAVQGAKPDDPDAPIPYVELKTSLDFAGQEFEERKFEKKLCRMWAQSFLLGVPKIVIGLRDRNGFLKRTLEFKTIDIPNLVSRQGFRSWDGNQCIKIAAAFLGYLKEHIKEGTVWRITKKKGVPEIVLHQIEGHEDIISEAYRQRANPSVSSIDPT